MFWCVLPTFYANVVVFRCPRIIEVFQYVGRKIGNPQGRIPGKGEGGIACEGIQHARSVVKTLSKECALLERGVDGSGRPVVAKTHVP